MASPKELLEQYERDETMRAEVAAIVSDGKLSPMEVLRFCRKYGVSLTPAELSEYWALAREKGLIGGEGRLGFTLSELPALIEKLRKRVE